MKRIAVIGITVAATAAVMVCAVFAACSVQVDMFGEGVLLLGSKQGKECAEGGGCAIVSKREMRLIEQAIRAQSTRGSSI
jgi:hypothetical protein